MLDEIVNWIVGRFISGQVVFLGFALCWVGCGSRKFSSRRWTQSIARIVVIMGALLIILSATPFPFWMYGVFFVLLVLVWIRFAKGTVSPAKSEYFVALLLLTQTLVMAGTEISYCLPPVLPLTAGSTLFVLGDSISIGADPPGKNWPDALGALAHLNVRNLAFGGAKFETALDNASWIDTDRAMVIVELGGNDILGGIPVRKFRADLERMLTRVCTAQRHVVMIELPLPPFCNRYGMVQRGLARTYGVTLVPKRYLAKVLSAPGATVDGLHFSNAGHAMFAHELFDLRDSEGSRGGK